MPDKPIKEIDHLLTYVENLDIAAALFQRMGFTLSPISHIESMGITNHLVLMPAVTAGLANFIELMSAQDRDKLPAVMVQILSGRPGIKSMVLGTDNAAVAYEAIRGLQFDVKPPMHVRREWVIGPGESVFPEFDVMLPAEAPLVFNCCQYHNVDLYLRPEWISHPNGAKGLRTVFAVAQDPAATAKTYGNVFGGPVVAGTQSCRTSPGRVVLELMTPAAVRARFDIDCNVVSGSAAYLGYGIEVDSLDRLKSCLREGKVPHRTMTSAICVDPADGLGNLIVFTEAG